MEYFPHLGGGISVCQQCVAKQLDDDRRADLEDIRARKHALADKQWQDRYARLQVGRRFLSRGFDDYQVDPANKAQAQALKTCQRYAETFRDRREAGDSLILTGSPGTGKNHLAAAICKAVIDMGLSALHTTALRLVREVKQTWGRNAGLSEAEAIEGFISPDLLVIDEVGCQFGSQAEQIVLMEVINSRYADMRPTVLLSNLPVGELKGILGPQVVDRFYEGKSVVLEMFWPSHRQRPK